MMNDDNDKDDGNDSIVLQPSITLLIENPKKSCNWGPLLRCCTAFDIKQIFVIGVDKCNVQGSHGASKHVELIAFPTVDDAIKVLKEELKFVLYGVLQGIPNVYDSQNNIVKKSIETTTFVRRPPPNHQNSNNKSQEQQQQKVFEERAEVSLGSKNDNDEKLYDNNRKSNPDKDKNDDEDIMEEKSNQQQSPRLHHHPKILSSIPVHYRPFSYRTCLIIEKKTKGLSWELAKHCDKFIHIPHQGFSSSSSSEESNNDNDHNNSSSSVGGRSWLSIEASLSIILHEFTEWAGYNNERKKYHGQKYDTTKINKGSTNSTTAEEKREQRKQKREAKEREEKQQQEQEQQLSLKSVDNNDVEGETTSNNLFLKQKEANKDNGDY